MDYYREQLERDHLAIITGLAGTGKTALGAELAVEQGRHGPVFWMTFRAGINIDVDAILQEIALFLQGLGQDGFWDFLQAEAEAGIRHPLNNKINYLVSALETDRYTLCFDNCELVGDKDEITSLFQILRDKALHTGTVNLIVMGRQKPDFAADLDVRPLGGMTASDARSLLADSGLESLPRNVFKRVHAVTEGNPMLLRLFSAWVVENERSGFARQYQVDEVASFIDGMWREPNIEQYLLVRVSNVLDQGERHALEVVSAFRQPFDDRDEAIIEIFAEAGVRRPLTVLRGLTRKHILTRSTGTGKIDCHALIRSYFYDRLREQSALKHDLHRRIGEYYESSQAAWLEAAYHYREANEYAYAVYILDTHRDELIGAGGAQRLLDILAPIRQCHVELSDWAAIVAMTGQARAFLGDYDEALSNFEESVTYFQDLALAEEQRRRTADLARQIGRLYGWRGEYEKAHARMDQGLQILGEPDSDDDRATAALIHTHTGSLYYLQGRYDMAKTACRQALDILADLPEGEIHAETYKVLGVIHDVTGDWEQAVDYAQRGLAIWERLGNQHRMAELRDNLGTVYFFQGKFRRAQALYEENLAFWDHVGARDKAGYARLNLGSVHLYLGQWEQANKCYSQALVAWRQTGNQKLIALAHNNLGFLEIARKNYEAARKHLEQSVDEDPGAENYRGLSEAELGLGHLDQALKYANKSLEQARISEMPFEEGSTLRTLGRIYRALGDPEQARQHLKESLSILTGLGARYEMGRTLYHLALLEAEIGEDKRSRQHLGKAITLFEEVGAKENLKRARNAI